VRVEPIIPDAPASSDTGNAESTEFARALDAFGAVLTDATAAEDSFAYGTGTLQNAIYERARADVLLSVATSSAQRVAQAVQSVLNMQV
jgi:ABC-type sulfate transport system permease component